MTDGTAKGRGKTDPSKAQATRAEGIPESVLVSRARAGDRAAYGEIVLLYQRRVYGLLRKMVWTHEDADDLAQDTFIRAWRALDSFEEGREFRPWLFKIATNLALNFLKQKKQRGNVPLDDVPESELRPAGPAADPVGEVVDRERMARVERALQTLPEEQRAVFLLRVREDLSYAEIAGALGIPVGTVMSRLSRAREAMRALFAETAS